ncbi:MAG: DNA polymerase I [Ruminococcaceae bacterium]|nr:DNA polymerase I [Oscillospiraceae bacterium]
MKLLAIDGNSIINRAFYGIKLLTTKDGQYTNAVYGFINILNRLIEQENPDGVAVAFDLKAPTFRHKMYDLYKSGRKPMPAELHSQMPLLKEWLTLRGYTCLEKEGFEADDILGTLAAAAGKNDTCIIATGDRDALQLIGDRVNVLLAATKMGRPEITVYNRDTLFEKYGLTPDGMLQLKSLMGDSSDKIPGVAGVGEKTATELIKTYGNIDYIYENIDTLDIKDSLKAKLKEGKDSAYLSLKLGEICKNVPIDTDYSRYEGKGKVTNELAAFMTKLEFFKLMENMGIAPVSAQVSLFDEREDNCEICPCEDILAAAKKAGRADILPDYENNRAGVCAGEFVGKTDLLCPDFIALLENEKIEKRVYDYKNLYKFYAKNGVTLNGVTFDSMLAAYLSNPSASSYDIDRLCLQYGGQVSADFEEDFLTLAAKHKAVCDSLSAELKEKEQDSLLLEIEIPLARVLGEMELDGFMVNAEGLKTEGEDLEKRILEIQSEIYSLVGYEFNLNSPKQLGVALFEKLGLPTKKKGKNGYSTAADVLEELKEIHPAVALLLEYRTLSKLKSTYCDGLLKAVGEDSRIHSTFNQAETRTGRISSLEPNLQNIPVRRPEGKKLRKFFVAKEGYTLCDADYSQIELRVLAHIADDPIMLGAFESGVDIHTVTAAQVFDMPTDMVTPLMRSRAKAVNFGIVYGIGAHSLSKDIGVSFKEAQQYIKGYLNTYKGVDKYMQETIEHAKETGYVKTLFGRRRYLPELSNSNAMMRSFGERVARNAPIQGTAADIIKIAMIRVSDRLKAEGLDAKLILQVHDELIVECREDLKEQVCRILEEEMQGAASLNVNLSVDANFGKTWFEAKGE